jgi:hypothetical protein
MENALTGSLTLVNHSDFNNLALPKYIKEIISKDHIKYKLYAVIDIEIPDQDDLRGGSGRGRGRGRGRDRGPPAADHGRGRGPPAAGPRVPSARPLDANYRNLVGYGLGILLQPGTYRDQSTFTEYLTQNGYMSPDRSMPRVRIEKHGNKHFICFYNEGGGSGNKTSHISLFPTDSQYKDGTLASMNPNRNEMGVFHYTMRGGFDERVKGTVDPNDVGFYWYINYREEGFYFSVNTRDRGAPTPHTVHILTLLNAFFYAHPFSDNPHLWTDAGFLNAAATDLVNEYYRGSGISNPFMGNKKGVNARYSVGDYERIKEVFDGWDPDDFPPPSMGKTPDDEKKGGSPSSTRKTPDGKKKGGVRRKTKRYKKKRSTTRRIQLYH